jgi:hypothetical protein
MNPGPPAVAFNLAALMRSHRVTIRDLAKRMDVTMIQIRRVRAMTTVCYLTYCDYTQAVTGRNVFDRAYYDRYETPFRPFGG